MRAPNLQSLTVVSWVRRAQADVQETRVFGWDRACGAILFAKRIALC